MRCLAELYNEILAKHRGDHAKAQQAIADLGLPLSRSAPRLNGQRPAEIIDIVRSHFHQVYVSFCAQAGCSSVICSCCFPPLPGAPYFQTMPSRSCNVPMYDPRL